MRYALLPLFCIKTTCIITLTLSLNNSLFASEAASASGTQTPPTSPFPLTLDNDPLNDPKTISLLNQSLGLEPEQLKKLYCPDLAKNTMLPPALRAFGSSSPDKQDQTELEFSKQIVNYAWVNSLAYLDKNNQHQLTTRMNYSKAPTHKPGDAPIDDMLLPRQDADAWKKRTLARALLSSRDINLLISTSPTTTGPKTVGTDLDFIALLPDAIFYPFVARKILSRMNDQLPVPESLSVLGMPSRRLPVYPTDNLPSLLFKDKAPLYSAGVQSAWARILEIAQKVNPQSKNPPKGTELTVLCDEFARLMWRVQNGKFDQIGHDIAKQNIHDSTPTSMRQQNPFNQNGLAPFGLTPHNKNQNPWKPNLGEEKKLSTEDGIEAGECFNEAYHDLVSSRSENLATNPEFDLFFNKNKAKNYDHLLRAVEQGNQSSALRMFIIQMRALKTEFTPEELASPELMEKKLTSKAFEVSDLDFDVDSFPDELKAQIKQSQSQISEDHAGSLLLFLKDYLPVLADITGRTNDKPDQLLNGSFNRFLNDRSPDKTNNTLFISALYTALKEEIPQAGILDSDKSTMVQNKIQRLLEAGIHYDYNKVLDRVENILKSYQPTKDANPQNLARPGFENFNGNELLKNYERLKQLRTIMLSTEEALRNRIKHCAETIAGRKGIKPDELYAALVKELFDRTVADNEIRKQKIIGQIDITPEENFTNLFNVFIVTQANSPDRAPSMNMHIKGLRINQLARENMEEAGHYFRDSYGVKALPEDKQVHGLLDMSNVPFLGKEMGTDTQSDAYQKALLDFLSFEKFRHIAALYTLEEAGNICRMYLPLLNEASRSALDPDVKSMCDNTADAKGVTAPHNFRAGNTVLIPNSYNPESERVGNELRALQQELKSVQSSTLKGRQQTTSTHKAFEESKKAKIQKLEEQIAAKQSEYNHSISDSMSTRAPRVLSSEEYEKEIEGFEKKARDLLQRYTKEMEDLDMFSGGYRDFWVNTFKNIYASVLAVPLMASTSLVGEGSEGWKAIKEMYKNQSDVLPKLLDLHDRFVNELFHMRSNLEERLGLVERFVEKEDGIHPIDNLERDHVFGYLMQAEGLFAHGTVKDKDGNDTGKEYGPTADYIRGAKAGLTELGITAATFGIGTGWNVGLRATTRFLGVGVRRSLAGRGIVRSFAQGARYLTPTNQVGRAFLGATLRRGVAQSTQVAIMNSVFPRSLPYVLEHTPVALQKWLYGAEIQQGGKHARDYLYGMMDDPWFKFKTDAVYQMFTPFYVSAEARMNAAMMKGYSRAMAAAERTQGITGQAFRGALRVPTKIPVIKATTISNALSGIPVDIYVQYFDPITGTRKKFEADIKSMEESLITMRAELASGRLSKQGVEDQLKRIAETEKSYRERLDEPFNQVRSGALMGGAMSWGMVGAGDPYEKVGIMMRQERAMTAERARQILKVPEDADIHMLSDLWQRTDQRMDEIWNNGKMFLPNTDTAASFEKMLEAMAAYNVLKRSARVP